MEYSHEFEYNDQTRHNTNNHEKVEEANNNHHFPIIPYKVSHYKEIEGILSLCKTANLDKTSFSFNTDSPYYSPSSKPSIYSISSSSNDFYMETGWSEDRKYSLRENFEKKLRNIYKSLPKGVYGDNLNIETKCDENIRSARDIEYPDFTVSDELLEELKRKWEKSYLFPHQVEIKPYKINMYSQGGKFAPHKDTPSKGFIGTMVYVLYNTSDAVFVVGGQEYKLEENKGVGFYGDVVHELKPITNNGFRVTLTCNVFVAPTLYSDVIASNNNKEFENIHALRMQIVKQQMEVLTKKYHGFGILSNYQYSHENEPTGLKGVDYYIKSALKAQNLDNFYDVNVVKYTSETFIQKSSSSAVYLLLEEDLAAYSFGNDEINININKKNKLNKNRDSKYLNDDGDKDIDINICRKGIRFFGFENKETFWSKTITEFSPYFGNDVTYKLIIIRKKLY